MTQAQYTHEDVAPVPVGYKVRTIKSGRHDLRVAFPPGRRRKGSGVLVSVLHPRGENPCPNPSSVFSFAVSLGYPYLRGEGRVARDGRTWLSRVTKKSDGTGPALYVGYDSMKRDWIVEKEQNPRSNQSETYSTASGKMDAFFDPSIKKWTATTYHERFGNLIASGNTAKEARYNLRKVIRRAEETGSARNPTKRELQKKARERAQRIREARLGPSNPWDRQTSAHLKTWLAEHSGLTGRDRAHAGKIIRQYVKVYPELIESPGARSWPEILRMAQSAYGNPSELHEAEDLYREFHGKDPSEILRIQRSAQERGEFTALGDLVELVMVAPNGDEVKIGFKGDGVRVASSPQGTQLYLFGGNQDISRNLGMFGADETKDFVDLGALKEIVYEASKWQTDFTAQEWKHKLGEESGIRPRAFFNQLKPEIFFAGGTYRVERPGIVD